jgi:hypothetical protein
VGLFVSGWQNQAGCPTLATVILSDLTLSLLKGKGVEEPAVVLRSTRSKEKTKISAENLPILAKFLQNYLYFDA